MVPVFVLTHHDREPLTLGETTFHFVTEGPERAVELAREAAGDEDAGVGGGGETIQELIRAGLLDELLVNQVPLILGGGTRLFDGIPASVKLKQTRVVEAPDVAHLFYSLSYQEPSSFAFCAANSSSVRMPCAFSSPSSFS